MRYFSFLCAFVISLSNSVPGPPSPMSDLKCYKREKLIKPFGLITALTNEKVLYAFRSHFFQKWHYSHVWMREGLNVWKMLLEEAAKILKRSINLARNANDDSEESDCLGDDEEDPLLNIGWSFKKKNRLIARINTALQPIVAHYGHHNLNRKKQQGAKADSNLLTEQNKWLTYKQWAKLKNMIWSQAK
eukprot:Pgem_evm1s4082